MTSSLIRQDVLPVGVGYLLVMGTLATGLWLIRRREEAASPGWRDRETAARHREGGEAAGTAGMRAAGPEAAGMRAGWPRLIRHYLGTATGGYLLLMAVVILYYYGVARVRGAFIESAFTGCALLIALATPVFLLASWLAAQRRRRRPARRPADPGPSTPGATP